MLVFPNAKINIGLNILRKREDGFHDIESCFYPIGLSDVLEVIESPKKEGLKFNLSGIAVEGDNLCVKAYKQLASLYALPPVKIHLHKIIPIGAGLGGGSADASFMLKVLNEMFALKLSSEKLKEQALFLGSDCPFFIDNVPVIAKGRGEVLNPIPLKLSGYHLVIIHPGIHISTTEAYRGVVPNRESTSLVEKLKSLKVKEWKNEIKNDFEQHIFKKYSVLENIKSKLYRLGAVYVSMSGSGSSMYGLFEEKPILKDAFSSYFVWQEQFIPIRN